MLPGHAAALCKIMLRLKGIHVHRHKPNMPTVPHGPLSLSLALSFLALSPSPSQRIQQMRIMSYHVLPLHRPTAQARRCNKEAWHFPSSLAGKKHICQLVKVCSTAFLHADCLPAGFDAGFLICLTAICTRADFSTFLYGLSGANLPTHGVLRCSLE